MSTSHCFFSYPQACKEIWRVQENYCTLGRQFIKWDLWFLGSSGISPKYIPVCVPSETSCFRVKALIHSHALFLLYSPSNACYSCTSLSRDESSEHTPWRSLCINALKRNNLKMSSLGNAVWLFSGGFYPPYTVGGLIDGLRQKAIVEVC